MRALRGECHKFGQEIDFDKRGILAEDAQTGISITNRYSSFWRLSASCKRKSRSSARRRRRMRLTYGSGDVARTFFQGIRWKDPALYENFSDEFMLVAEQVVRDKSKEIVSLGPHAETFILDAGWNHRVLIRRIVTTSRPDKLTLDQHLLGNTLNPFTRILYDVFFYREIRTENEYL